MHISVVTTSFPLTDASTSGVFVKRMVENLPDTVEATVVTPADSARGTNKTVGRHRIKAFRYAPRRLQVIAHQPGGVLSALAAHRTLYLLLPFFLFVLFWQCFLSARRSSLMQANWSINGVIAGVAGFLTGTPVITTLRGSDVSRLSQSKMSRVLLRLCNKLSARLVAVGENQKQLIADLYPDVAARIQVIPNGISDDFLQVGSNRCYSKEGPLRLITVGNLITLKGVDTLLRALATLADPTAVSLTIVGDGPEQKNLQTLGRTLKLNNQIQFLGAMPAGQIPRLMGEADVLVMPSLREGRPNVVLEAMAAGLPVIGSDIAAITELVKAEVNGLLFTAGDQQQLAVQLKRLIDTPILGETLGRAAHKFLLENNLTWQACGESYGALFDDVIGQTSN